MKSLIKLLVISGVVYAVSRVARRRSSEMVAAREEPLVIDSEVFIGVVEIPEPLAQVLEELSVEDTHRNPR
jgi:hypothetical protein